MDKKERELRMELKEQRDAANKLIEEGKTKEAREKLDQAKATKEKLDLYLEARGIEAPEMKKREIPNPELKEERGNEEMKKEYRSAFLKMVRGKRLTLDEHDLLESKEFRAMSGINDEDGGLIIPQDIQTKINELKRQFDSLEQYVTIEPVVTRSGSRVLEKNADMVPFAEVQEMGEIPDTDNPKFTSLSYNIKDYAGILPISNTLLADTDQNLMNYIARWFAKKSIVTRNSLILNIVNAISKTEFENTDSIKRALNVTLDPMISQSSIVLTNQDGFNYLDLLKDGNGQYLLQPNPANPTQKMLFGKPVAVISNRFLESDETGKAPVIVGDLKEAVVLFDRQQMSLASTNVGAGAFETNTTKVRAIERQDVRSWDKEALVFGQLDLSGETPPVEG